LRLAGNNKHFSLKITVGLAECEQEVDVAVDEQGRPPSQWKCEVWGDIF